MKAFIPLAFDANRCRKEALQLRALLAAKGHLKEREHILPFFRKRPHLAAACGYYNTSFVHCNCIAWEYDLFGDFACDLVVGDTKHHAFTFVEFEDAGPNSLFVKQAKKSTRAWSPRLNDGYGQIIDWFYKLSDRRNSEEHEARFGKRAIDFAGLLVIGRNQHMDAGERLRLEWRREHVIVYSKKIQCITFDELLDDILTRVTDLTMGAKGQKRRKA